MTSTLELKQRVLALIQTLPICIPNSASTQWTVRCPYCGDSMKHHSHGHLSILIDLNNSDLPMLYRCFRCNESGILSADTLEDLGLYAGDLKDELKKGFRRITNAAYYSLQPKKYIVPSFLENQYNLEKLYYINERLGTSFDIEDCKPNKFILNLFEFMDVNHIHQIPNVSQRLMRFINEHYVGFLSSNNNRIVFRSIHNTPDIKRYYKMILDPNNLSKNTFYALPGAFDLMYTDDVHIHIAEGTFDILSITYNMPHSAPGKHLFYASCGFNFNSILRYLIAKGVNTNVYLHIYSDRDKSDREHAKYLNTMQNRLWIDHVFIHRNMFQNEKDYGVTPGKIHDAFIKIR